MLIVRRHSALFDTEKLNSMYSMNTRRTFVGQYCWTTCWSTLVVVCPRLITNKVSLWMQAYLSMMIPSATQQIQHKILFCIFEIKHCVQNNTSHNTAVGNRRKTSTCQIHVRRQWLPPVIPAVLVDSQYRVAATAACHTLTWMDNGECTPCRKSL